MQLLLLRKTPPFPIIGITLIIFPPEEATYCFTGAKHRVGNI